jgi:hypothetical protein
MSDSTQPPGHRSPGGPAAGDQLPPEDSQGFLDSLAGDANDRLTDHSYDGIHEYDNPLPGWWKWLFILTILFCFPYIAFYHSGRRSLAGGSLRGRVSRQRPAAVR